MNVNEKITILTNHLVRMILENDPFIFHGSKIHLFEDEMNGTELRILQPDNPEIKKAVFSFDFPELDVKDDKLDVAVKIASYVSMNLHDYYRRKKNASKGGKKSSSNLTPEQRRERAKKAVATRIAKYGQKSQNSQ